MSHRFGIVQSTEPSGYAHVMTERKTVCGGCSQKKTACYGCMVSPKIVGRVANPLGAKEGDLVKIHIFAGKLLLAAGMFYLLPILTLLLGAGAGIYGSGIFGFSETAATIGGAFSGLLVGIVFVTALGRIDTICKLLEPSITSIIKSKPVKAA